MTIFIQLDYHVCKPSDFVLACSLTVNEKRVTYAQRSCMAGIESKANREPVEIPTTVEAKKRIQIAFDRGARMCQLLFPPI